MAAPERPLLISRAPTPQEFRRRRPQGRGARNPIKARQIERLEPMFSALQEMLEAKRAALQTDPSGPAIEQVIVFETNGPVKDLYNTIGRTPGLEWLADDEIRELAPDEDFFVPKNKGDASRDTKLLVAHVYLVLFNQEAMEQLLRLWEHWRNGRLPKPFSAWRPVFAQLRDVRRWSVRDRLQETRLLDYWRDRIAAGYETVTIEIELWFRSLARRTAAEQQLRRHVGQMRGQVLATCLVEPIAYHAVVARLPITAVEQILENPEVELLQCEDIRIVRPTAQAAFPTLQEPVEDDVVAAPNPRPTGVAVAALLDGLPVENHPRLAGGLIVDDPDGWAATYPASSRSHGTGMASLILNGDLAVEAAVSDRPLYVRPILRPSSFDGKIERAPEDGSWLDLIHRAVRRLVEGEGEEPPVAPSVCVINLSIGDPYQPFIRTLSPLARLLDWLAWSYKILFVVSAGNHVAELSLHTESGGGVDALISALASGQRHRRILSPAEAVNALTVGALDRDSGAAFQRRDASDHVFELPDGLPSPISGLGRGYRRAVKPDVLTPGGRAVFSRTPGADHGVESYAPAAPRPRFPPGHLVAAPGLASGGGGVRYICGTSNAAALTTRLTVQVYDALAALRDEPNAEELANVPMALWLRALVVHGASWSPGAVAALKAALKPEPNKHSFTDEISAILGYGSLDPQRVLNCTAERATILAAGSIAADQRFVHQIPIPASLHAHTGWRRLTLTLAWFTPINPTHQKYRRASLWFDPPGTHSNTLVVNRTGVHWQAVRRGTLQHETLEGEGSAIVIGPDATLEVPVSCMAEAGGLDETVPYALVATLEVAPGVNTRIYDEVRARIAPRVDVRAAR
jgi:hypothetical protein